MDVSAVHQSQLRAEDEHLSKKELRQRMKRVLSNVTEEEIKRQSHDATSTLLRLPEYQNARRISVFMSMPKGELQTNSIVRDALKGNKHVFIPYIYKIVSPDGGRKQSIMDMLRLQNEEDYASLEGDKWGIPSISSDSATNRGNCFGGTGLTNGETGAVAADAGLDLILMPAMAFDMEMNRLGHGMGYYDQFLKRYLESSSAEGPGLRKPHLIGLILEEQMLPDPQRLPIESWDHRVDSIICGGPLISSGSKP